MPTTPTPPSSPAPPPGGAPGAIEYDAEAARSWMLAVAAGEVTELASDDPTGVFGSRVALLDFDADDLARIRRMVPFVRLAPDPRIQSAIAISGSSAQGKVQLFPGDTDFFERVNIRATSEAEAHGILREAMHATALRAFGLPDVVLVEANLGVYPEAVVERGRAKDAGDSVEWAPGDVLAREITVDAAAGGTRTYRWDDVALGNGFYYFGWIVADRELGRIMFASNMIDPTWEDEHGVIRSIDGAVDQLAQEVYLEPDALPLVERLHAITPPDAREAYRQAMRSEARYYTAVSPNYAKAAKRLYNLFRVADELEAAAYVRELFDEPAARLYQVPVMLWAADLALDPESGIDRGTVLRQIDVVADAIDEATDGEEEAALLAQLGRLRERALAEGRAGEEWADVLADVRARCAEMVSEFFRHHLLAHERVRALVEEIRGS